MAVKDNPTLSEDMQDLLSYRLPWVIRKGNSFFLLILILFLGSTWFIRYPDSVKAPIKLAPVGPNHYYGQMVVAQKEAGKIKIGQNVLIKLENYPGADFGDLVGNITSISRNPAAKDSVWVTVGLPKGLQTTSDRTIPYDNDLHAQAEVLTGSRKLFDRLYTGFSALNPLNHLHGDRLHR